jgi:hypothetical protein
MSSKHPEAAAYGLSIAAARRLTTVGGMSLEDVVTGVRIMAHEREQVEAAFVHEALDLLDEDQQLSVSDAVARTTFVANLERLFSSSSRSRTATPSSGTSRRSAASTQQQGGTVSVAELCVGLSMLCRSGPMARILLVVGLYRDAVSTGGGGGGGGTAAAAGGGAALEGLQQVHVFHFMQQVCRFLTALQPLHADSEQDVDMAAMAMTTDVLDFAAAAAAAKEAKQRRSGRVRAAEAGAAVVVPVDVFARWWLENQLDSDGGESGEAYLRGLHDDTTTTTTTTTTNTNTNTNTSAMSEQPPRGHVDDGNDDDDDDDVWASLLRIVVARAEARGGGSRAPLVVARSDLATEELTAALLSPGAASVHAGDSVGGERLSAVQAAVSLVVDVFDQLARATTGEGELGERKRKGEERSRRQVVVVGGGGAKSGGGGGGAGGAVAVPLVRVEYLAVALLFVLGVDVGGGGGEDSSVDGGGGGGGGAAAGCGLSAAHLAFRLYAQVRDQALVSSVVVMAPPCRHHRRRRCRRRGDGLHRAGHRRRPLRVLIA